MWSFTDGFMQDREGLEKVGLGQKDMVNVSPKSC